MTGVNTLALGIVWKTDRMPMSMPTVPMLYRIRSLTVHLVYESDRLLPSFDRRASFLG
jgi:hypothetical protein